MSRPTRRDCDRMSDAIHLTVRADAYGAIGIGHVMRCLALAQAWRESGGTVTFVSHCDDEGMFRRLEDECTKVVRLERLHLAGNDLDRLLEILAEQPGSPVA